MSLESILEHILTQAKLEAEKIIQAVKSEAEKIIQTAKKEAEIIYQEDMTKEKNLYEKEKQKLTVFSRLESRKKILSTKQELIDSVFKKLKLNLDKTKFKKQQVTPDKVELVAEDIDFYLKNIRPDFESEIAQILFK